MLLLWRGEGGGEMSNLVVAILNKPLLLSSAWDERRPGET